MGPASGPAGPAVERCRLCGWHFETGPGYLRGRPGLFHRAGASARWAFTAALIVGTVLLLATGRKHGPVPRALRRAEVLRLGWPAALVAAPVGWVLASRRIEIDRNRDAFRLGGTRGQASAIRVVWLVFTPYGTIFHKNRWPRSRSELRAGLDDGRVIPIFTSDSKTADIERLGLAIARGLEVPLQTRHDD